MNNSPINKKKPIRVLSIFRGNERPLTACEIYRITMPLEYLGRQPGWETSWRYFESIWHDFQLYGRAAIYELLSYDIIVFPRVAALDSNEELGLKILFATLKQGGVRVIYETDDDYTNVHRQVTVGDAMTPMSWADAVTVTTRFLAQNMRQYTRQPIYELPNCIDPAVWRDASPIEEGRLTIGLTGSQTHETDWIVLKDVMPAILAAHKHVHFVVMGYHPEYLAGLPNTTYVDPMRYDLYSRVIRTCSIILAPVDPCDGFNNGKSPIKAVEGQGARRFLPGGRPAGAAVIATDNPVYGLAVNHLSTGMLTEHTPVAWVASLHRLITDNELRERLQIAGHKDVYRRFDISREYMQWARAYRKILLSPALPVTLPAVER